VISVPFSSRRLIASLVRPTAPKMSRLFASLCLCYGLLGRASSEDTSVAVTTSVYEHCGNLPSQENIQIKLVRVSGERTGRLCDVPRSRVTCETGCSARQKNCRQVETARGRNAPGYFLLVWYRHLFFFPVVFASIIHSPSRPSVSHFSSPASRSQKAIV